MQCDGCSLEVVANIRRGVRVTMTPIADTVVGLKQGDELENQGEKMQRDESFEKNTAEYTKLASKYAPHLAIYLHRKSR